MIALDRNWCWISDRAWPRATAISHPPELQRGLRYEISSYGHTGYHSRQVDQVSPSGSARRQSVQLSRWLLYETSKAPHPTSPVTRPLSSAKRAYCKPSRLHLSGIAIDAISKLHRLSNNGLVVQQLGRDRLNRSLTQGLLKIVVFFIVRANRN